SGEHDIGAVFSGNAGDFGAVGGDDAVVGDADLADAFPDAEDQRDAAKEAERLAGETGRPQSSWDDGERPHSSRLCALPATTVTPKKCRLTSGHLQRRPWGNARTYEIRGGSSPLAPDMH